MKKVYSETDYENIGKLINNPIFSSLLNDLKTVFFSASYVNNDWIITDISENCYEVFEYKKEEVIGRSHLMYNALCPNQEREKTLKKFFRDTVNSYENNNEMKFSIEYPVFTKSKRIIYINEVSTVLYNQDKLPSKITGYLQDKSKEKKIDNEINEYKKYYDNLNKNKDDEIKTILEKYKILIDNTQDAILIIQDEIVKMANEGLAKLMQCELTYCINKNYTDFIEETELNKIKDNYNKRISGNKNVPNVYETKIVTTKGEIKSIEVNVGLINYENYPAIVVSIRDIDRRKKLEESLNENEKRLNFTLNSIENGIWDWDLLNKKLYVNKQFSEIMGENFNTEIFVDNNWFEKNVHPDDKNILKVEINSVVNNLKDYFEQDYRIINANSKNYIWIYCKGKVVSRDNTGKATRIIGLQSDVTLRKETINDLQKKYDFLEKLLSTIPIPIVCENLKGEIKSYNNSFKEFFGLKNKTIERTNISEVFSNYIENFSYLKKSFEISEVDEHKIEAKIKITNELEKDVFIYRKRYKDQVASEDCVITTIIDNSENKFIIDELESYNHFINSLLKNIPLILCSIDMENNLIYCEGKGLELFEFNISSYVGKNIKELISDKQDIVNVLEYVKSGNEYNGIFTYSDYYFNIYIAPVKDNSGKVKNIVGFILDVTEKTLIEQELKNTIEELAYNRDTIEKVNSELILANIKLEENEKKLSELNSSKDKFFSIIAHDLRGPFSSILGLTEIMAESFYDKNDDPNKEIIDVLYDTSKKTLSLLENLLDWARLQIGRYEINKSYFDISMINQSIIQFFNLKANRKDLRIINNIPIGSIVYADQNMIETVLRNLINNAIKFTSNGGIINIDFEYYNEIAKIAIRDSGIGIKKDDINKLFRIDVQFSKLGLSGEKGTGVGLVLCKELIEKNNGNIYVESEEGKGSDFIFTLPIKQK